eukprot:gene8699-2906_t
MASATPAPPIIITASWRGIGATMPYNYEVVDDCGSTFKAYFDIPCEYSAIVLGFWPKLLPRTGGVRGGGVILRMRPSCFLALSFGDQCRRTVRRRKKTNEDALARTRMEEFSGQICSSKHAS